MASVNKSVKLKESFCLLRYSLRRRRAGFSTTSDKNETTHFGFQTVLEHEKAGKGYIPLQSKLGAIDLRFTLCQELIHLTNLESHIKIIKFTCREVLSTGTSKEPKPDNYIYNNLNSVFEAVANSYDQMNDAMSFGIHRFWKDVFIQRLAPTAGTLLLDVAGGTGDIAFRFLKYMSSNYKMNKTGDNGHVTVCDINKEMLKVGQQRAEKLDLECSAISWLHGDAENLPIEDCAYSAYSIAFGIRNVTHISKVLQEAYRVLKPGGRFVCLEFSHVNNKYLQWAYDQYSFQMIPVMGQLIAGQWKPYQYLVESIRQFPDQEEFKCMINSAGFKQVSYENLTFGIVAIHSGFKL